MKRILNTIILTIACSLHSCATTDIFSGKEITVSLGADGKPVVGLNITPSK